MTKAWTWPALSVYEPPAPQSPTAPHDTDATFADPPLFRAAVPGASVAVELLYPDGSTVDLAGTTGPTGVAVVRHPVTDVGTYMFTVLEVMRPPAVYDPAQNVETSDSVTIPGSYPALPVVRHPLTQAGHQSLS